MRFKLSTFFEYLVKLLPYLKVTFTYAGLSLVFGIVFGFLFAVFKLGKSRILRGIANVYTAIFRSVPPVVLLFLVYYGIPMAAEAITGKSMGRKEPILFVIITVTLLATASLTEIMRSAYKSVDKGQYEAGVSIGLTEIQTFFRIVFPQALLYALPSLGNLVIYLIKEGSLGFTIGLVDIFGKANTLNQNTYSNHILEIYIALATIYWVVAIATEKLLKYAEQKVKRELGRA
ncbi:amino acid ABC transporter permease [Butyrivibrio sp. AE2032]|jgi:L-cystine transport system permease protein|uniref:amino acid ABC transporter permease n=1 Tax=Butyrivibrio sp. AE2032 TaxID=1458463 RepID=UPI00054D410B|nr:amino acid ABC transporter permease [Butyrivibrio sp. AE2032]